MQMARQHQAEAEAKRAKDLEQARIENDRAEEARAMAEYER